MITKYAQTIGASLQAVWVSGLGCPYQKQEKDWDDCLFLNGDHKTIYYIELLNHNLYSHLI